MSNITFPQGVILTSIAFLAGMIDSIVGGGGLIQLPGIMAVLPGAPVVFLLGTNKLSSCFGTGLAVIQYARKMPIEWKKVLPMAALAFCTGIGGALVAIVVPNQWLKPLVLVLLIAVLIYTVLKKDLGATVRQVSLTRKKQLILSLLAAAVIGFYDGFFGPGTGNFLILVLISIYGMDFLNASASCKIINLATNVGALILFSSAGTVYVGLGLMMAVFNMAGAFVGVRLAILKGSRFIRILFIVIVTGLIIKQAIDFL